MADVAARPDDAGSALALTIACDERLREMVRAVAARTSRLLGSGPERSEGIGQAVDRVVAGVMEHACRGDRSKAIDIRFLSHGSTIDVEIRFPETGGAPQVDAVERTVGAGDQAVTAPGSCGVVSSLEFGREDGCVLCRLRCPLSDAG